MQKYIHVYVCMRIYIRGSRYYIHKRVKTLGKARQW